MKKAFGYATRSRHSGRRTGISGRARIRFGRMWPEPPPQQHQRPLHLGRSKSGMVHPTYRPSRRPRAQRNVDLHSIMAGAAR